MNSIPSHEQSYHVISEQISLVVTSVLPLLRFNLPPRPITKKRWKSRRPRPMETCPEPQMLASGLIQTLLLYPIIWFHLGEVIHTSRPLLESKSSKQCYACSCQANLSLLNYRSEMEARSFTESIRFHGANAQPQARQLCRATLTASALHWASQEATINEVGIQRFHYGTGFPSSLGRHDFLKPPSAAVKHEDQVGRARIAKI